MAFATTALTLTTGAPQPLITQATTWAHLRNASISDPVPFAVTNLSTAQNFYVTGTSTGTSATGGFTVGTTGTLSFNLLGDGALYGFTTDATVAVRLIAGRQ